MLPYILLISIPLLFIFTSVNKDHKRGSTITIGVSEMNNKSNLAIWIFFLLYFLLLALRREDLGRDLPNYFYYFRKFAKYNFKELLQDPNEPLFKLINKAISMITEEKQWYLVITSALTVFPIAYVYNKDRSHGFLKIIVFVNMSTFIMLFSGIRQSLAMGVGMFAYLCVKEKKKILFIILGIVAILIHHSGFMVLLMYPIYYMTFTKKNISIFLAITLFTFALNKQIFGILSTILSKFSDKYDFYTSETAAFGSLILFVIFSVFAYFISDEEKMNEESFGLRNFLFFTVVIQCFAPLNSLAMRMNYYYILFIPLALGDAIKNSKDEQKGIARLAEAVICIFFTIAFINSIYAANKAGVGRLETVPYRFFWQEY